MVLPRIYVAGHRGLVGSAIVRAYQARGGVELLTYTRAELDLEDQLAVRARLEADRPEYIILAAAKVGGIVANRDFQADFIRSNLAIQCNVIETAYRIGVKKLLFLGSSCVYPKFAKQPITEDELLAGPLEPTNQAYAVAKIAGLQMCQSYNTQYGTNFVSVMPTNLYGPGDNFDLHNSHVLPALIRRFHEAKRDGRPSVTLWGSGSPRREFLHVDDMAAACLTVMDKHDGSELINLGTGTDVAIKELAEMVRTAVGYTGQIEWDISRPDGTPRKLLDVSRLSALGWTPKVALADGIASTYAWYLANAEHLRG